MEISIDKCPNCGAPLEVNANGRCSYCDAVIHDDRMMLSTNAPSPTPEIIELVRAGKKIQAIKAYRELTGLGLADAKAVIDSEEARLQFN